MSIDSQVMEVNICNTVTFGLRFTPPTETLAQSYINWTNFLSSSINESTFLFNESMRHYNSGVLYISYFLLKPIQNQSLTYDFNFSTLINNSIIFTNSSAPTLTFDVSTSPEAVITPL